jgi:hypothetical protein
MDIKALFVGLVNKLTGKVRDKRDLPPEPTWLKKSGRKSIYTNNRSQIATLFMELEWRTVV